MKLTENKLKRIVLNELQRYLTEDEAIDSKYLRDHLDYFIEGDFYDEDEKKYLKWLKSLINQLHPNEDLTKEDVFELTRSDFRFPNEVAEEVDYYTLINQIWEQI